MSKAFDTVNRTTNLEDLRKIVEPDELHLIKILLQQVSKMEILLERNLKPTLEYHKETP